MTILDELKKAVSEYYGDFKKHDMAGVIVSHKTFQDIRTQHPLGFIETSDGDAYLYGFLVIKHPLCPADGTVERKYQKELKKLGGIK